PAPVVEETAVVEPTPNGQLLLSAAGAEIHGEKLNTEDRDGQINLGFWDNAAEWVSWMMRVPKPGKYNVSASIATVNEGAQVFIQSGSATLSKTIESTGDWGNFKTFQLGQLNISEPGGQLLSLRPKDPSSWKPINLRTIRLEPVTE
ncbi:MAG TPA: carbohydrate-binding domain-containing protein, partial [Verrucomicrobiae bacterium]|nr:carbohydrate-binding domain-containing protein [Verrucomicrobiae bacterium]